MTTEQRVLTFIIALVVYSIFYYMGNKIDELNHRVSVLEDQMETTMNILTEDGIR